MTKRQETMLRQWENAWATELWQVYDSFSGYKARSYEKIKRECADNNGYSLYITGNCCSNYSCAYKYDKDNTTYLVYHTYRNRYEFEI